VGERGGRGGLFSVPQAGPRAALTNHPPNMRRRLCFLSKNVFWASYFFELDFYLLRPNRQSHGTAVVHVMLQCASSCGHMRALRYVKKVLRGFSWWWWRV
jgi:hypothetical protein